MRAISPRQYLQLIALKAGTLDAQVSRRELPFAFGLERRLVKGTLLDLDAVAVGIRDELAVTFGLRVSAAIVLGFADLWLAGIGRADSESEAVFLRISEFGQERHTGANFRSKQNAQIITLAEFATQPDAEAPVRITCINLSAILAVIRTRAAKVGLDFDAPFFPSADDPIAAEVIATAKTARERALEIFHTDRLARAARLPAASTSAN